MLVLVLVLRRYLLDRLVGLQGDVGNVGVHHEGEQVEDQVGVPADQDGTTRETGVRRDHKQTGIRTGPQRRPGSGRDHKGDRGSGRDHKGDRDQDGTTKQTGSALSQGVSTFFFPKVRILSRVK